MAGPDPHDPHQFASASADVPAAVLDAIANASGSGRVTTRVLVFSRAVVDLVVPAFTLDYDPAGGP
jgi:hypothetical protein